MRQDDIDGLLDKAIETARKIAQRHAESTLRLSLTGSDDDGQQRLVNDIAASMLAMAVRAVSESRERDAAERIKGGGT